jgi:hypothetical protein
MSENKFIEDMLNYQENLDNLTQIRENFLEGHDFIFQSVMNSVKSEKEKMKIKKAYEEFLKAEEEVFEEKGHDGTMDDIKKITPQNYWLDLVDSVLEPDDSKVDFDKIWEEITKKLEEDKIRGVLDEEIIDEELEEAKRKGRIN